MPIYRTALQQVYGEIVASFGRFPDRQPAKLMVAPDRYLEPVDVFAPISRFAPPIPMRPLLVRRHDGQRSEEHTSEIQSLMRLSYAVFFLNKKKENHNIKYQD